MDSSPPKKRDWFRYTVLFPAFLTACFLFLWHASLTHLGFVPKIDEPKAAYHVQHDLCQEDCRVIRNIGCREWSDVVRPKLCEFVCDTYLDDDTIRYSKHYKAIFTCIKDAESESDIEVCGMTCTSMDLL